MSRETFYITTPIYYPSNTLHIGNAYSTIAADVMARYKRLRGFDVFYLTGTDEHGQKLQRRAAEEGKTPRQFIDPVVEWIQDLWGKLDISYDDFIRTTEERHKRVVQQMFQQLQEQGDIYLGVYEGYYCVPCEAFWTEYQAKGDGQGEFLCPDCGRGVHLVKEESYFFRMSKYQEALLAHIERNPEFIQPESRRNEMVNNFLKPGLEDLCVSRTSFDWGIPVKSNPEHVIYVWLDALSNYITALGYRSEDRAAQARFARYWPADVHVIGKDILRFHTIYWPIMLMALGLPLPKKVFGHGWLLMPDGKMSKSKGNVIDPKFLIERYGSDAIRYFLLREIAFGQDGVFTTEAFIQRLNFDLANDLGNLVSRTAAMVEKYQKGQLLPPGPPLPEDEVLMTLAQEVPQKTEEYMEQMQFSLALQQIWQLIRQMNRYIDEMEPWNLAKSEAAQERLASVLYHLVEGVRIVSILLQPFLTKAPQSIWQQMGLRGHPELLTWEAAKKWGQTPAGLTVRKEEALFPRLDVAGEIAVIDQSTAAARQKADENARQTKGEAVKQAPVQKERESAPSALEGVQRIGIDDFFRVQLQVAQVMAAERISGADKLLKLQLDLGEESRQVVSGIAQHYTPESLIGTKVVCVTNLQPVKLRGEFSNGMILAAAEGDRLVLVTLSGDIPNGTRVK